jgi:enamine deaminase RidA (YjgF/YER057c/UK114 family)
MEIESKLRALGFELPIPAGVVGNYIAHVQVGNILFLGGNVGRVEGRPMKYVGKVGDQVTLDQAYELARDCALVHLARIKTALGDLARVERVIRVTGYINVAPGFNDMPKVLNGQSDLLVQLWGEQGRHTRAAIGVASLGLDAPVETDLTVQVKT